MAPRCAGLRFAGGWLFAAALAALATAPALAKDHRPPNVVLVLIDDLGWRDVGFMGNRFVETPNIDRLAQRGVMFSQAYASAPNCAPTRACLMSGQYTPRHGVYTVVDPRQPPGSPWHKLQAADSKAELATEVLTIAEALQSGGYATGFFGMWNLGRGRTGPVTPGGQGFDRVVFPETLGFQKDAYFDREQRYLSDRLTDEVLKFIEENRNRPFFAYLPDHAVHAPFEPKPDLLQKYARKLQAGAREQADDPAYAATIEAVDQNVGRIVDALERLKLTDHTLVIFTSDNGGVPQYTAPLRGGKGQLYEGGVRVPLVFAGPGVVKPGSVCDAPASSIDLYPTLLELAGVAPSKGQILDGVSLAPALRGGQLARSRLFWHFPCYVGRAAPSSSVREGDFKLIEFFEDGGRREMYNLRDDPYEKRDLAAQLPDKAAVLYAALQQWQRETGAAIPSQANPKYDPQAERPRGAQPSINKQKPRTGK